MCGRYGLYEDPGFLAAYFGVEAEEFSPRYNIAPTQEALIVRRRADGDRGLTSARWGLVPHWVKDPATFRANLFNARSETAAQKPSFREPLARSRCLVPVSAFYEWRREEGGKQPYLIRRRDGAPLALAGLWSLNGSGPQALRSFTILTTGPNELLARLHDRMPVVLRPDDLDLWLDPSVRDVRMLERLFAPVAAELLEALPVGPRVNSPRNDDPGLAEPVGPPMSV